MPTTDALDDRLETLIGQASTAIESWTSRRFARERVTERFAEDAGTKIYLLERRPVITLHSIKVGDSTLAAADWSLTTPEAGLLTLEGYGGPNVLWDELIGDYGESQYGYRGGRKARITVEVDYTGGYVVPDQVFDSDAVDLPADLELACQIAVRSFLEGIDRPAGLTSERLGDASWSYGPTPGSRGFLTDDVKSLVAIYRMVPI